MNKAELVNAVAKETGLSKSKSKMAINAIMKSITESLSNGERVTLVGFGTFNVVKRNARRGRNPKTGEAIKIPAKNITRFKIGSKLRETIN